jgi:hypothetical protein
MHGGEFGRKLTEFLAWLKHHDGVSINPKIAIADLRSRGAGRSVGTFNLFCNGSTMA